MRKSFSSGSPWEPRLGSCRAVRVDNHISVAGTAPLDSNGKIVGVGDAATQARQCLVIIKQALEALDASLNHVVRTRLLLKNIADWQSVGLVHGEFFGPIRPVTTVMANVVFTDPDWLVEIEADAILPSTADA